MNRIATCFFLLLFSITSQAQSKTYIGAEVAHSIDIFKTWDGGRMVTKPEVNATLVGINIRHYYFDQLLFAESGFYTRAFKSGLAFRDNSGTQTKDRTGYFIPLRLGATIPVIKKALAVSPVVGLNLGTLTKSTNNLQQGTYVQEGTRTITYRNTIDHPGSSLVLFQFGAGIDVRLFPAVILELSSHYYAGPSILLDQFIQYSEEGIPVGRKATQTSRGSFYTFGVGLKYAVNWF